MNMAHNHEHSHSHSHDHEHEHEHEGGDLNKRKIIQLISGIILFATGLVLKKIFPDAGAFHFAVFGFSYLILGGEVVLQALKNIARGELFDENFLMSVATIGAFAIGDFPEGVAVMLFYQIGEYFQDAAVQKSKKSITSLMDIRPDYANLKRDNNTEKVAPDTVKIGDIILIRPGEKIPLDGSVLDGESMLDTSALTGESVPRSVKAGEPVLAGCINQSGVLTVEVTKEFGESTVAKIIDLVENASSKKAPSENFITTFSRYYTPVVVGLALLLAVIPPLFYGGTWAEWINRGLIFLVISCPCALVISIPLGFFGGIGAASKRGILIKGSNYLEALNSLDTVVFDKTGTLTKGKPKAFPTTPSHVPL
jgi:Cd2+/Zn2+-exporting ATPase